MELNEAIETRRTIRIFKAGVTEAQLRKLLAMGAKAPSTRNKQSWEFVWVTEQQLVDQIAELKYQYNRKFPPGPGESQQEVEERALNQKRWFAHASVVAVCTQGGDVASAWLAVENISLAAIADGLGSGIIGMGGMEKKAVETLLGLPAGYEMVCILKLGVPAGPVTKPPMRPDFSWLHTNTF
jgi:nitroreductase